MKGNKGSVLRENEHFCSALHPSDFFVPTMADTLGALGHVFVVLRMNGWD